MYPSANLYEVQQLCNVSDRLPTWRGNILSFQKHLGALDAWPASSLFKSF
jgi:hypothetical protein